MLNGTIDQGSIPKGSKFFNFGIAKIGQRGMSMPSGLYVIYPVSSVVPSGIFLSWYSFQSIKYNPNLVPYICKYWIITEVVGGGEMVLVALY
jgi:hypothetical protein